MSDPVVVTFVATLAEKGACLTAYSDGTCRLVLEASQTQFKKLATLAHYGRQTALRIRVEIDDPSND